MESIEFEDLLNKCRCCFQYFKEDCLKVEITSILENEFLELTSVELHHDSNYSSYFCNSCDDKLKISLSFMQQAKHQQIQLYEYFSRQTGTEEDTENHIEFEKIEIHSIMDYEETCHLEDKQESIPIPKIVEIKRNDSHVKRLMSKSQVEHETSTSKKISEILPKLRSKREGTFSCQICELKFHQRKNLLIHKRNSHLKNVKCKNEDCNLMFRFESSMELHFNRDHLNIKSESNLSFYCDQCEYKTQLKNSMKRHVTRHIEKTLKCDKCSYKTYRLEVLTLHKLSHGSRSSFPCEFCGKILTKLTTLKSHIRIHHTETSYPCEFCEFSAKSIFSLDNHWKKSHPQLQPSIPCEYKECNEKFFTKQVLKKHLRDKHLANIKCLDENCTRMFYYENLMLNHFSMVHEKEKYAGEHLCNICGKTFTFITYLRDHMKTHLEVREKFKCEFCDKEYLSLKSLKTHRQQHIKSHPDIQCDKCDKKFFDTRSLRIHVNGSHHAFEPICEICGKSFRRLEGLREHWKTQHDDKEPNIQCEHCSEKFKTRRNLSVHISAKHQELKSCEFCDKKFRIFLYKRHLQSAHLNMRFHCVYPGCFKSYAFKPKVKKHLLKHTSNLAELNNYYLILKDLKATESLE